jgi:hypothetical protein
VSNLRRHQIVSIVVSCIGIGLFGLQFVQPLADTLSSTSSALLTIIGLAAIFFVIPGITPLLLTLVSTWTYFTVEAGRSPLNYVPKFLTAKGWKAEIEPLPQHIENLGLQLVGAFEVRKRYFPEYNGTIWVYSDESRTVFLELIVYANGQYGVEIRTEYSDGFLLGTLYNIALQMDTNRFFVRSFESLHEAWDYHLYQAQLLEAEHGQPVQFDTLEAYLGGTEKEIKENKAIALDGAIAHLKMAKRSLLALVLVLTIQALAPVLGNTTTTISAILLLLGIAFWFVDFITPPQQVLQTMEQRKKQKSAA